MKLSREKHTIDSKHIYARLREWTGAPPGEREAKEIERLTGIPYTTLKSWKSGGPLPQLVKLVDICKRLDVDPIWLLFGVELASQPRGDAGPGLETASSPDVPAFLRALMPDEQRALLDIVPMLLTIYRAQKAGDEEAREAWEVCRDKVMIVARALSVSLPRPTGKLGGRKPPRT